VPVLLKFDGYRELRFGDGTARDAELMVSRGLEFDIKSEVLASECLDSCIVGGCVAEVGVGSDGACGRFAATVDLRFLFGCPFEYCGFCESRMPC
jgi:hypothetical protein